MKKTIATLLLSLFAGTSAGSESELLHEALSNLENHTATFTQTLSLEGLDNARAEQGTVTFGDLPRMNWLYQKPKRKRFVFDGRTSWLYVPAENQVLIHEITGEEREKLPLLFLDDAKWVERNFRISAKSSSGKQIITLDALNPAAIRRVVAEIDLRTRRLTSLTWVDQEGTRTRFELTDFRKSDTPPSRFRFNVPAGTDVVRN